MKTIMLVVFSALLASALPAKAATEEEVRAQIEELLGDSAGFEAASDDIAQAILTDDPDALADHTEFPLGNSGDDVEDSEGLAERWDELFTAKVKNAVDTARYDQFIVNSEGVGIGDGEIWINHFCDNDSCTKAHWALARVNN